MFGVGYRTPAKGGKQTDSVAQRLVSPQEKVAVEAGPSEADGFKKVRRSIGEWEAGKVAPIKTPPSNTAKGPHAKNTTLTSAAISLGMELTKPRGRVAEAKACLIKAKLQINSSRNLKAEIKAEVLLAVETLYRLVKEAEAAKPLPPSPAVTSSLAKPVSSGVKEALEGQGRMVKESLDLTADMRKQLKSQADQVAAVALEVGAIKDQLQHIKVGLDTNKVLDGVTYAAVAAAKPPVDNLPARPQAVHSVVVSSDDAHDTSEDVLNKIRTAVSARTTGIRVDRLRKAKDQKVVLGCQSREEMAKVMERLKADSPTLQIKEVANRDPLVIMFGVLSFNTDEEVLGALKRQNCHLLGSIPEQDYRASVKFRRKARNPLECHVVLQVSPRVWQSLTVEGRAHVDLQRVVVKDQSPLVTCSRCLGYGHGRKTCPESADTCSHCAGSHLRSECPAWKAGEDPTCCNCQSARLDRTDHNSFDGACPIRKKWDALARARVAYC